MGGTEDKFSYSTSKNVCADYCRTDDIFRFDYSLLRHIVIEIKLNMANLPLRCSGRSFICWLSAERLFLMLHPSYPCVLLVLPNREVKGMSARSGFDSNQTRRAYSHADGAAPGDRIRGAFHPQTAGRNSSRSGRRSMRLRYRCTAW